MMTVQEEAEDQRIRDECTAPQHCGAFAFVPVFFLLCQNICCKTNLKSDGLPGGPFYH